MEKFKPLKEQVTVDFTPKDVKFEKYILPNALGKAEAEEMVARFLEILQESNEWQAVDVKLVCKKMDEQAKDIKAKKNIGIRTLIPLDLYNISCSPTFAEIGLNYLFMGKYIEMQRFGTGEDVEIYIGPTNKLLEALKKFVVA